MKGVELLLLFVTRIKCITFRLSLSKQVHVLVFTRLRLLIEWTAIKSSRLNIILYMNFFFFHVFIRSSNIWLSYILNRIFITSRVYLEPLSWPAPSWLVSSVGRALHRYRRGHGFKSRTGLKFFFFRPYFHYCLSSAHHCEDHFHSYLYPQFKYMTFIYS